MSTNTNHQPQYRLINREQVSCVTEDSMLIAAGHPLCCAKDLLGVLLVEPADGRPFSASIISEIATFLSICAMPMQIYRLGVLNNWRVKQLAIVRKVSDRITSIDNLDNLCGQVTKAIKDNLQYYNVSFYTVEKDGSILCLRQIFKKLGFK